MASTTISEITINKIRIGGKAPKAIHKGGVEVKKVTKGSTVVYQKEDVTYNLTGSNPGTFTSSTSPITFTVASYKGSSTAVALSTSNISVTAGGGTVASVTNSNGYYYLIKINVSENTSTTSQKTHTIKITQPTSGLTLTLTAYQAAKTHYLQLDKVGFRFYGTFPSNSFTVTFNSVYIKRSSDTYNVYFENLFGSSGYLSTATANSGTIYYSSALSSKFGSGQPQVRNSEVFGANFGFGATWAGSSGYSGSIWKLQMSDTYSGKTYIVNNTSSKTWEVGVQPANHGVQTSFSNITETKSVSLVVDVRWSW